MSFAVIGDEAFLECLVQLLVDCLDGDSGRDFEQEPLGRAAASNQGPVRASLRATSSRADPR